MTTNKILRLVRVPYGKITTPIKDREYVVENHPGCPVGTIAEWKEFAKAKGFSEIGCKETFYVVSAEQINEKSMEAK
jgi:hypothetical protein